MTVGKRIQEARKNAGMKQSDLAEKLGVAVITIGQYERGKRQPNLGQLQRIATALDVPVPELMGLEQIDDVTWGREASPERTKEFPDRLWEKYLPQGSRARIEVALDQLSEEGQEKVAAYAEDLIPRYRAKTASQSPPAPVKGTDATPPSEIPEGPPEDE